MTAGRSQIEVYRSGGQRPGYNFPKSIATRSLRPPSRPVGERGLIEHETSAPCQPHPGLRPREVGFLLSPQPEKGPVPPTAPEVLSLPHRRRIPIRLSEPSPHGPIWITHGVYGAGYGLRKSGCGSKETPPPSALVRKGFSRPGPWGRQKFHARVQVLTLISKKRVRISRWQ